MEKFKIVHRDKIKDKDFRLILDTETHHDHEIYEDDNGTLRWKENPSVNKILSKISLNDLCPLLSILGYGKNSEVYRKLYRDMGYSLFGYWEIFYWDLNNEEANEYKPNSNKIKSKKALNVDLTDSQIGLMYIIKEYKELPIDSFQMNKRALNQLIKKGYVTTNNYANGEFSSLTDSGNEIMEYLSKKE
jgi:hypothetical protein